MNEPAIYRDAKSTDAELIVDFIHELAAYEKLADQVAVRPNDITTGLFGPQPKAHAMIAEADGGPVGFALFFYTFSTFVGRPGLYVEDIYIRPDFRNKGIGKGFFGKLAEKAAAEGCGRIEWAVLDWNEPAIAFYEGLGATALDAWTTYRLDRSAIEALAHS